MSVKKLNPAILLLLALATHGISHAAEQAVDCMLKGGTVVQLPAEACRLEGGTLVNEAASAVQSPAPEAKSLTKLEATQKLIVDILGKTVESAVPLERNPEVIERTAKFEGCRLVVDEQMHIQYGNAFSVWRDFKINAVVDFQNIKRDEFGILGEIASEGGELTGVAVYFEQRKRKGGNDISIAVQYLRKGKYIKYTIHGPSPYWDAPKDDLWIEDEYGYTKDTDWNTAATDMVRILFIVNSSDDATRLKEAMEEVFAMCKSSPAVTN